MNFCLLKKTGFFVATFFLIAEFSSCKKKTDSSKTVQALGTICTIQLYENASDALYAELFNRLFQIESEFSVQNPDSELSRVNAASGKNAVFVGQDVAFVLQTALDVAQKSDGAFDPTIGPLVNLWGINTENAHVPAQQEIENAKSLVNWRNVDFSLTQNGAEVFLQKEGMALDLGGIAKGFAADELAKILKEKKVSYALINLGGNVFAFGNKKSNANWKIGIRNPFATQADVALVLELGGDASVVTSGSYERFFEQDGKLYHHILDPRTGYPCESGFESVSIILPSSLFADAFSTTAFVLGDSDFWARFDCEAIFIKSDGRVIASSSLQNKLSVFDPHFSECEFRN